MLDLRRNLGCWVTPGAALLALVLLAGPLPAQTGASSSPLTPPSSSRSLSSGPPSVFGVPLLAVARSGVPSDEAGALERLTEGYVALGGQENPAAAREIADFLRKFPSSPQAVSLWQEKAAIEWRHGSFSDAPASLRAAWEAGKNLTGLEERRLAEAGLSDLLLTLSRMGRKAELRQLVDSLAQRPLGGMAQEALLRAKETLWFLENKAEQNVVCGFSAANEICVPKGQKPIFPDVHDETEQREFIANGLSLFELRAHNHEADGDLRILKRTAAVRDLPVPSIIHWKFGHYSAITERSGSQYRIKDEHLKYDGWVSAETLERETSVYLLASAATPVPAGFTEVSDAEAKTIFGRHCTHARDDEGGGGPFPDPPPGQPPFGGPPPGPLPPGPPPPGTPPPGCPMASYRFSLLNPGLELHDTPISYDAPYGPAVAFTLEFDQRSTVIADVQPHANFGPRWTYGFLGHINLVGTGTPSSSVRVVFGNGTYYSYSYSTAAGTYTPKYQDRARLNYVAAGAGGPGYRLQFADGSEFFYARPNTATPTRYYLTSAKDPNGNALTLGYDADLRLTSITDAAGLVTSLSFTPEAGDQVPTDTKKVRSITDPFGRKASFKYTAAGQLQRIIDPIGIVSEFAYGASDFVSSLTTPYGTTSFVFGELPGINAEPGRFIEATDPAGDKERAEANDFSDYPANGVDPNPAPASVTVAGQAIPFFPKNDNLFYRNTFHWDKLQMKFHAGDCSKATIYNWKATSDSTITSILGSFKRPLEGRVWFNYPGQTSADGLGTHQSPSKTVRAVEKPDGTLAWTMAQAEYDPTFGKVRRTVDALGRETIYEYNPDGTVPGAVQGMDLTAIKQKQGTAFVVLARFSDFVAHQPRSVTDAAGQVTAYQYNGVGQVTSVTNAKGETTTFAYHPADVAGKQRKGRLSQINGALAGNSDVVSFDYDAAGHVASVTGPDGYFLRFAYDAIDRLTRVTFPDDTYTETTYFRLDPLTSRDRLGRLTHYVYNSIRQVESVTDPLNRTVGYRWCKCGDLRQLIDALGRITTWQHDAAGRVTAKVYADNSKISYAYEPLSGRLSSITDEKGQVKTRAYNLDSTLAGLTYTNAEHATPNVAFTYDSDFRRLKTMLDGIGTTTYAYQPIAAGTLGAGRLASVDGPLPDDTLTYAYDELGRNTGYAINGVGETRAFDPLGRLLSAVNPLGTFGYTYAGATGRMDQVTYPNGMTCQYNYHPLTGDFRLKDIIHTLPGNTPLSRHSYEYNAVGNITRWTQISPQAGLRRSWLCGYDDADQLTSVASQDPDTLAALPTGQYGYTYDLAANRLTETIDGVTTIASFNALNQLTSLTTAGASTLPQQIYEWDAEDRLSAINYAGTNERTEFEYDSFNRRLWIREKQGASLTSSRRLVWRGMKVAEEHNSTGVVQHRYFPRGLQTIGTSSTLESRLLSHDRLGSVRELVSPAGGLTNAYDFDPWGRHTMAIGSSDESSLTFTGHWFHKRSSFAMAPFRAYNSNIGRWLSRDPIEELADLNLYAYVGNSPTIFVDPLGLEQCPIPPQPEPPQPPDDPWWKKLWNYHPRSPSGSLKEGMKVLGRNPEATYKGLNWAIETGSGEYYRDLVGKAERGELPP